MSVTAKQLVQTSKLMRESGHCSQSAKIISLAKSNFPPSPELVEEEQKIVRMANRPYPRGRAVLSSFVDRLGLPAVFLLMALVATLLGPILFVPAS